MRKKFLSNTIITRIRNLEKKETDTKAKARLLVCIQRKQGNTLEQIAENLNTPQRTIRRWLKNIQNGVVVFGQTCHHSSFRKNRLF